MVLLTFSTGNLAVTHPAFQRSEFLSQKIGTGLIPVVAMRRKQGPEGWDEY